MPLRDGISSSGVTLSNATPQSVGTAAAGTSIVASRDDHVHAHGNQASNSSLHAAAVANGNAGFMSGADKAKLDGLTSGSLVGSATPQQVGTAGAAGVSTNASREDHVHAHGAQTDGTLHAAATQSVAGFLAASDKQLYDGQAPAGRTLKSHTGFTGSAFMEKTYAYKTTDATPVVLETFTQPVGSTWTGQAMSTGSHDNANYDSQITAFTVRNQDGSIVNISTASQLNNTGGVPGGMSIFANNGLGTWSLRVAGIAGTTMYWIVYLRLLKGVLTDV